MENKTKGRPNLTSAAAVAVGLESAASRDCPFNTIICGRWTIHNIAKFFLYKNVQTFK